MIRKSLLWRFYIVKDIYQVVLTQVCINHKRFSLPAVNDLKHCGVWNDRTKVIRNKNNFVGSRIKRNCYKLWFFLYWKTLYDPMPVYV